jgi:hypothetical protein
MLLYNHSVCSFLSHHFQWRVRFNILQDRWNVLILYTDIITFKNLNSSLNKLNVVIFERKRWRKSASCKALHWTQRISN